MKVTIRQKADMHYLYADISVSGIRTKASLGVSIKEGKFNLKSQTIEGVADYESNVLINTFKNEIMGLIRTLQQRGELTKPNLMIGVKSIKEKLTNPNHHQEQTIYFLDYVSRHIERSKATRKHITIVQYKNILNKLKTFESGQKIRLTFDGVDYDFYNAYIDYCKQDLNLSTNSIGKHIKHIKMWMNSATEEGLNTNMMYRSKLFKKPQEEADTIYLNEDELARINNLSFIIAITKI